MFECLNARIVAAYFNHTTTGSLVPETVKAKEVPIGLV
jgi:hypothetical protein